LVGLAAPDGDANAFVAELQMLDNQERAASEEYDAGCYVRRGVIKRWPGEAGQIRVRGTIQMLRSAFVRCDPDCGANLMSAHLKFTLDACVAF
jgi:hypothetical protein